MTLLEAMSVVLVFIALSLLFIVVSTCRAMASVAKSCEHLNVSVTHLSQNVDTPSEPSVTQAELDAYYKEQASAIDAARKIQALFLDADQMKGQGDV